MGAISTLTIPDGKATPVSHTFAPAKATADLALYEDRSATSYIGYNKITLTLKRPTGPSNGSNRNLKCECKIETPILESVAGDTTDGYAPAAKVAYRLVCTISMDLPERCTLAERNDLLAFASAIVANPPFTTFVREYAVPY